MKFIIISFLFILSGASCAAEHTAPQLLQMINEKGANAVVHTLYNDNESEWWNHIIPEISKGNNDWLTVASALEPGVDASTAEDLQGRYLKPFHIIQPVFWLFSTIRDHC